MYVGGEGEAFARNPNVHDFNCIATVKTELARRYATCERTVVSTFLLTSKRTTPGSFAPASALFVNEIPDFQEDFKNAGT